MRAATLVHASGDEARSRRRVVDRLSHPPITAHFAGMHRASIRLLVLMAGLVTCRDEPIVCTLIGCNDVLTVAIAGAPTQTLVTVVATQLDAPVASMSSSCTATTGSCSVSFSGFAPSNVRIDVSWDSQTKQVTVQPAYQISRPNGPDCPPACRFATVSVTL